MIQQEALLRILKAAVQAPSGDNAQPWKFEVRGDAIRLINIPEKDTSPFNYQQASNYVALGAALENLCIAARAEGFSTASKHFPDATNEAVVAEVTLSSATSEEGLVHYITERASNRRKYKDRSIPETELTALSGCAEEGLRIAFVTDKSNIEIVAYAVSAGEKIALENKSIHDFLFDHVTWTQKEEFARHGFYIKTFEFKPPQELAFKIFRNWNTLNFFNRFGVSNFIAKDSESIYQSSPVFGAIIAKGRTKEDFLSSGVSLERLWLTAVKSGLSLQPTTSVHFLMMPILDSASTLSDAHQQLLRNRYALLANQFKLGSQEYITFLFRIGFADTPSGRTTRAEPIVENYA